MAEWDAGTMADEIGSGSQESPPSNKRYIPVIALVSEDLVRELRPIVDGAIRQFEQMSAAEPVVQELFRRNGWTSEMFAWGAVILTMAMRWREDKQ